MVRRMIYLLFGFLLIGIGFAANPPTLTLANSISGTNMTDVVIGSPSSNALMTASCLAGHTCQIWYAGASHASGTTSTTLAYNTLPQGFSTIYANDITALGASTNYTVRMIKISHNVTITLTNSQTTNVDSNTPLSITLNAVSYTPWETNTLNNTLISFPNGTVVYSWVEGNLSNEQKNTNSLYLSNNVIFWFKSPNSKNWLGSSKTNNVILSFAGTVLNSANMLFDGNFIGEAPQLNCVNPVIPSNCVGTASASKYAQWDTGANVFSQYDNFAGTSLSTNWTSLGSPTVNNGITLLGSSSGKIVSTSTFDWSLYALDSLGYVKQTGSGTDPDISINSNNAEFINIVGPYAVFTASGYAVIGTYQSANHVLTLYQTGTTAVGSVDYTTATASKGGARASGVTTMELNAQNNLNNYIFSQWTRLRKQPSNNTMPSYTFSPSSSTLSVSLSSCPLRNKVNVNQTEKCTVAITGGVAPYTINWAAVNALNLNAINSITYTGVSSSSNTFAFVPQQPDTSNSPGEINVIVSDFAGNTVNTIFSTTFTINSELTTNTFTSSNSIVEPLQYELTNCVWSGGTSPYTANFYITNSVNSNVVANIKYTALTTTSNTYFFQIPNTANAVGTLNTKCTITDASSIVGLKAITNTINDYSSLSTPSISVSISPSINPGQTEVFTSSWSGGFGTYTANYQIVNSISGLLITNMLYSGISGTTNTFSWLVPAATTGNIIVANVFITDNVTTPVTMNSAKSSSVTIATTLVATLGVPSNIVVDVGQFETLKATATAGTSPYTYSISSFNGVITVHNYLSPSISATTNTFNYKVIQADVSNSPERANVVITDSVSTTVNSLQSVNIFISNTMTTPTLSLSQTTNIAGNQNEVFTATVTGGSSPYTFNFLVYNSFTNSLITSTVYTSVSSTTNTFSWLVPQSQTGNTFYANVVITDGATTPVTLNSILTSNVIIQALPPTVTITPSNSFTQGTISSIAAISNPSGDTVGIYINGQLLGSGTSVSISLTNYPSGILLYNITDSAVNTWSNGIITIASAGGGGGTPGGGGSGGGSIIPVININTGTNSSIIVTAVNRYTCQSAKNDKLLNLTLTFFTIAIGIQNIVPSPIMNSTSFSNQSNSITSNQPAVPSTSQQNSFSIPVWVIILSILGIISVILFIKGISDYTIPVSGVVIILIVYLMVPIITSCTLG